MKYYIIILWLLVVSLVGKSQNNSSFFKHEAVFLFKYSDSSKATYSLVTSEGVKVIALYSDGVFEYEQQYIPNYNSFCAGRWRVLGDTVLILEPVDFLREEIFNRRQRRASFQQYKNYSLSNFPHFIEPGKAIRIRE